MQQDQSAEAAHPQFGQTKALASSIGVFGLIVLSLEIGGYLLAPHTNGGGWGPPAGLMWVIAIVVTTVGCMALVCPPIFIFLALSKSSRVAALTTYCGLALGYLFVVSYWYSPWIPLRQNLGVKLEMTGYIWIYATVYVFVALWFLMRPTWARLRETSIATVISLLTVFAFLKSL
jgi:hypothetical protein